MAPSLNNLLQQPTAVYGRPANTIPLLDQWAAPYSMGSSTTAAAATIPSSSAAAAVVDIGNDPFAPTPITAPTVSSTTPPCFFTDLSPADADWLEDWTLSIPDIATEPLTGTQLFERLAEKFTHVLTRYIPCVEFLVDCQQELRAGLEQQLYGSSRSRATRFYQVYIHNLPVQFSIKYPRLCTTSAGETTACLTDLESLRADAARQTTPDAVKASFLGGMKDGESWGLRKWLARHGGGLGVCTDLECVLARWRAMYGNADDPTAERLGRWVRPVAKHVLNQLQTEIPSSYQKHSTAHPYLPYFHRLEAALKNMARYGEKEEVICLDSDDDEDDVVEVVEAPRQKKRPAEDSKPPARARPHPRSTTAAANTTSPLLQHPPPQHDSASSSGESVAGEEIEVVQRTAPWPLPLLDVRHSHDAALHLGQQVYDLARRWENNHCIRPPCVQASPFWTHHFSAALRLFADLLTQHPHASMHFMDTVQDDACIQHGHEVPFSHSIKHPIGWSDIGASLLDEKGILRRDRTLDHWNMYNAKELLQAIDLVMLNHLAYAKVHISNDASSTSRCRALTNPLRKLLWNGIQGILHQNKNADKRDTPTRRTETSGFVIYKIHTSRR